MSKYKDKNWLSHMYQEKSLSLHEIGRICSVDGKTIHYWMKKFDIETRSKEDAVITHFNKERKTYNNICRNCDETFKVSTKSQTNPNSKAYVGFCSDKCRSLFRVKNKQTYSRECPCCNNVFTCEMKAMTDPKSSKFKKYCSMKCVLISTRKSGTWIEIEIENFLKSNNCTFVSQYKVGRFTADFYIPSSNTIIEANGDFWHANPDIYSDETSLYKIQREALAKDKRKLTQLNEKGYRVLVVWENDLKTKKSETLLALLNEIKSA